VNAPLEGTTEDDEEIEEDTIFRTEIREQQANLYEEY